MVKMLAVLVSTISNYVPWGGGAHIVFSVDPVSVSTCLYSISEWTDFGQTYTNISLGGGKNAD